MDIDQYFELARGLEQHHAVFYKMWELGKPTFTNAIETAAVIFDEEGECFDFQFNEDFWNELNSKQKQFVVAHECLHVLLNHGTRIKDCGRAGNIAADVVVNHTLVNKFDFNRDDLGSMSQTGCWVDTVWPDGSVSATNETLEFYLKHLEREEEQESDGLMAGSGDSCDSCGSSIAGSGAPQPIDDHSDLPSMPQEMSEEIAESLSEEQRETFNQMAGNEAGSTKLIVPPEPVKKKKKWETVIKKWSRKYDKPEFKDVEQWARLNRRFMFLSNEFFLPTEMELDHNAEGKTDVWFFQDTSGSCQQYAKRFLTAARSLNPNVFNIRAFCFDTQVYEVDINKGELKGFGGTWFHILEDHIQKLMKEERCEYPKALFVITDGWGSHIYPEQPKNWYWFITPRGSINCIPKECNTFKLEDYE